MLVDVLTDRFLNDIIINKYILHAARIKSFEGVTIYNKQIYYNRGKMSSTSKATGYIYIFQ